MSASSSPRETLRLKTPLELATTVPYLLGYHPRHSFVLVGLTNGRVGMSMRADLQSERGTLVRTSLDFLRPSRPTQVVAVLYDAPPREADALVVVLRRECARRGIGVREVVRVADGRCWSVMCPNPRCCPPAGWELPRPDPVMVSAAAAAMGTDVPLDSREALESRLTDLPESQRDLMRRAIELAVPEDWADTRERLAACLESLESSPDGSRLDPVACAHIIVSACDVHVRDRVIAYCLELPSPGLAEQVLIELTRRAVDDWAAPIVTAAAMLAWRRGSGTRARIAAERALDVDADYPLATLVLMGLDAGMGPDTWEDAFKDLLD